MDRLLFHSAAIEMLEAAGEKSKLPTLSILAYTGGVIQPQAWSDRVIIDLAGLQIPTQQQPLRCNHSEEEGIGHTTSITKTAKEVRAIGVVSRDTPTAREFIIAAKNGFPWQASVGLVVNRREFLEAGATAIVNGNVVEGPVVVARDSILREISLVDLGADAKTEVAIAAAADTGKEKNTMDGNKKVEEQKEEKLEAAAEQSPVDKVMASVGAEKQRQEDIARLIEAQVKQPGANIDKLAAIGKQAIEAGWSAQTAELEILRAARVAPVNVSVHDRPVSGKVLEAALLLKAGFNDNVLAKDRSYGAEVVDAAYSQRNNGLHFLLASALRAVGVAAPHGGSNLWRAVLDNRNALLAAGYSTVNLPGILGNVANKMLLRGFEAIPATYERVAQQADYSNFHEHTMYRLNMLGSFSEVPAGGTIPHGELSESEYTNQLATYGMMLTLTRQAIVNDDLSALDAITRELGGLARKKVEETLYDGVVMESSNVFYTSGQGNLIASNGLTVAHLAVAEAAFADMKDANSQPIMVSPSILLVPPALRYIADQLYVSGTLAYAGGTAAQVVAGYPVDNVFRGRFRVESSHYMADAHGLTGSSDTTWYMLADPNVLPAFQVAYLDGKRAPTVESADTEFNTLGTSFRCYFDFGVSRVDYRGAVKSTA
jgi:hypothetical protein